MVEKQTWTRSEQGRKLQRAGRQKNDMQALIYEERRCGQGVTGLGKDVGQMDILTNTMIGAGWRA